MIVEIDGREIYTARDFHLALKRSQVVPDFYGCNLDAFWDALTGLIERPCTIVWRYAFVSKVRLGPCFRQLVEMMDEAAQRDVDAGYTERFRYQLID